MYKKITYRLLDPIGKSMRLICEIDDTLKDLNGRDWRTVVNTQIKTLADYSTSNTLLNSDELYKLLDELANFYYCIKEESYE